MRPLALLAASIPLALGCAQQSLQRPADVATDQPLKVTLHNPTGAGLTYSLSEPAYVAVFAISRTGGVGLVYPTREDQALAASLAGANQLRVGSRATVSMYNVDRTLEERGILASADAYYIIASKRPLNGMAEMVRSPGALGTFADQFRAASLSSAGEEIGFALTRGSPDDEWAEDTYFGSRRPFQSLTAMQRTFPGYCAAKGVYSVRMTSTAQCEKRPGAKTAARNSATPPKPNN